MTLNTDDEANELSRYKVTSRREIIHLLRSVSEKNQLVRMQANRGVDSAVTSIIAVDEDDDVVIVDCAPGTLTNQRVLNSEEIFFETMLEKIRILFSAPGAEDCMHDGRPALRIPLPEHVVRLQRREFYRVKTPVVNPVQCTIRLPDEVADGASVTLPLYNISGGGISVTDDRSLILVELGKDFKNCRIDLPGTPVTLALRFMNSQEIRLTNGKSIRRHGFMFVDPPNAAVAAIQRYITRLEREQRARAPG